MAGVTRGQPVWTSYTATVTGSITNPTLGTASSNTGYFARSGKIVTVRFLIQFGSSGVAVGSGDYYVALPVAAASTVVARAIGGNGYGYDSSANVIQLVTMYLPDVNRVAFIYNTSFAGAYARIGSAAPWVWAANDNFEGSFTYEAA